MRDFVKKFESGEYVKEWKGYSPFYAGNFYGSDLVMEGDRCFRHCCDFFSGIGDVEWWIVEELDKLSVEDKNELLSLLERNKKNYNRIRDNSDRIKEMSEILNLEGPHIIYRKNYRDKLALLDSKNIQETWNIINPEVSE